MDTEAKKKPLVSNSVLIGILGVLLVLIIILIVVVVMRKENALEEQGEQKTSYEIAQEACGEMKALNPSKSEREAFRAAVEKFESVANEIELEGNEEFKTCFASLTSYYTNLDKNSDKAEYYGDLYDSFLSEDEQAELERMRALKKQNSGG